MPELIVIDPVPAQPPQLSGAQRLWLLEIGLDRPMLARLTPKQAIATTNANTRQEAQRTAVASEANEPSVSAAASAAFAALRAPDNQSGFKRTQQLLAVEAARAGTAIVPAVASQDEETSGDSHAALRARIQSCELCALHTGRHRAVAGAGATEAVEWLVVGEAPGDRDDRLGEPFQGKAGELLHAMLDAAGIDPKKKVFYTNLVKCRPRSNRPPSPEEITACIPHLRTEIALLQPRGILALGRLAAQALLADDKPFEEQRGRVHAFQAGDGNTIPMVVTYHPASLLSRPRHKAASWRDLNLARGLSA